MKYYNTDDLHKAKTAELFLTEDQAIEIFSQVLDIICKFKAKNLDPDLKTALCFRLKVKRFGINSPVDMAHVYEAMTINLEGIMRDEDINVGIQSKRNLDAW